MKTEVKRIFGPQIDKMTTKTVQRML